MKVLGIHDAFDAGAALVIDGELRMALNEERLNRVKNFHERRGRRWGFVPVIEQSAYPRLAIEKILATQGLTPADIDRIVLPHARPREFLTSIPKKFYAAGFWRALLYTPVILPLCLLYWYNKRRLIASTLAALRAHGFDTSRVHFVGHHEAHAAAAYRTSGWDDALVVVADLEGDLTSTTVWRACDNTLTLLHEQMFPLGSLGAFYGNATGSIGFRKHVDECKVMGLAAYGKPTCLDQVTPLITWNAAHGRIDSRRPLGLRRFLRDLAARHDKRDVASSAQQRLEDVLVPFIRHWMQRTGCRRVCYGGGVAHNVIANQRVQEIPGLEALHIFPHTGDGGLACGAALEHWYRSAHRTDGRPSVRLDRADLGPAYSSEEIRAALAEYGLPGQRSEDAARELGELLARGLVCGLYQGRMEIGPRALGYRSILSTPRGAAAKDKVNYKVKFRESWRPFALSVLDEHRDEYLVRPTDAPFMLLGFQVVPERFDDVRSASHIDGSTRPQTVTRAANPFYHAAITRFHELTGIAGVLNTSLNRRGEPVCCTPQDAIECFLGSEMDALVLGDHVLLKKDVRKDQLKTFAAIEQDVPIPASVE